MLIALYGINNIGKSTQVTRLVSRLREQGVDAIAFKYPVYELEPSGSFLNAVLRGGAQKISEAELQLWFTLNRHQFESRLREHLTQGRTVVVEDYTGTGLAWGEAKGLSREWLKTVNKGLIQEDLSILMDGSRHMEARETSHVHEQDDALSERCRQIHLELAHEYGWSVVSSEGSVEAVHERIWEVIDKRMKCFAGKSLQP